MHSPLILLYKILLWTSLAYLVYVEVGYLLLLWMISKFRKPYGQPEGSYQHPITVLIAAHNEEAVIAPKLDNILGQDYPSDLLQVIVASDHSTDRTDQIVRGYAGRGVVLCRADQHGGKIAALRAAEHLINGQVVVFTDADAVFQPGAIRTLVRHFKDPKVGAVSGREIRPGTGPQDKGKGEGLYNRIETLVKRLEARVGNLVVLHGGIFAIRRELLPYVPDHLTHDGIVPCQLTLDGYVVRYEPQAVSVEAYHLDSRQDFKRRIRTVLQAYQSYLSVKEALNPFRTGFFAIQVWSHRILRWFVFPILMVVLITNLLLVGQSPFYLALAVLQGICYLLAMIGFLLDRAGLRPGLFYFPFYFVYLHLAAFYAILLSWSGRNIATWQSSRRFEGQNAT